ncbi:MAG: extracellular solute-binding protein [Phycisphaerales bacterium]|nr:extracellular solute-binding protein [Phycisphaerales bacterium]
MRRWIFLILFAGVLALPFALRAFLARPKQIIGADAFRLVIVTPNNQDIRREFSDAFDQWHRRHFGKSVLIDYRTPGGTNDIKRLLETTYRAYLRPDGTFWDQMPADIHIVWGGGDYFFDRELKRLFVREGKPISILQPLSLDRPLLNRVFPEDSIAGVRLYDTSVDSAGNPVPQWVGGCLSAFGMVYNPTLYDALKLPALRTWADLADPRLSGLVALADPTHSGSVALAYMMVIQRAMADEEAIYLRQRGLSHVEDKNDPAYQAALSRGWKRGMGQLLLIAANARYFTDSASQVPTDVGNGDAAAGVAIDFYARVTEESVGPDRARFVMPPAASAITPDPVAILAGVRGEAREVAGHFVRFLLSPEGQRLWILKAGVPGGPAHRSLRRSPIRRDVYADKTQWADDVDLFALAGGFNQRAEWFGLFADTRTLWAAAWIDSRDALKRAYASILAVKDQSRRGQLLMELANLPVERADVEQLARQRAELERAGGADEWKARQRIDWANRFRSHYERIMAEARSSNAHHDLPN